MMSRKNRVRQIIKAPVTVMTLIALTGGFRVIKAALDDVCGRTRWTRDAVWPAQITDGLITLHLIDQIFDVDLQRWTPVRGWDMAGHQYTTSSHATTLESNKSVKFLDRYKPLEIKRSAEEPGCHDVVAPHGLQAPLEKSVWLCYSFFL
jgi:hypothetical protein